MDAAGVGSVEFDDNFEESQPSRENEAEDEDAEPSWEDIVRDLANYQAQIGIQTQDDLQ